MGYLVKCEHCGKSHRYEADEVINYGTMWEIILAAPCPDCNNLCVWPVNGELSFDFGTNYAEFWLQAYVESNYQKLGFTAISEPRGSGPDFIAAIDGKEVLVEVETSWQNYLNHKHHLDPRWNDVEILIVLGPEPVPADNDNLPKRVIYVDQDDFDRWFEPRRKKANENKKNKTIFKMIGEEFWRRFRHDCNDKDRDMATCDECDYCPYFMEEGREALNQMAFKFVAKYNIRILDKNFDIRTIKAQDINDFYLMEIYGMEYSMEEIDE